MAVLSLPAAPQRAVPSRAVSPPERLGRPSRAERRLAAGLRRGDPQALTGVHEHYGRTVFGYLRHAMPDVATAEDVFQQVMTEVWRRSEQYDAKRASLLTWIMTITRSRAIDELRRRIPEPVDPERLPEVAGASEGDALIERLRVAELLALLRDHERDLLRMRFYEELSQTEIAERTGIPLGTVKTRMVQALERLRELAEAEEQRTARVLDGHPVRSAAGEALA